MAVKLITILIASFLGVNVALTTNPYPPFDSLTPEGDTSTYFTETKRMRDDIVTNINLLRQGLTDDFKKIHSFVDAVDRTLKTEIQMSKSETANNLKRHSTNILTWLVTQFVALTREWPRYTGKLFTQIREIDTKSDTAVNVLHEIFDWKEGIQTLLEKYKSDLDHKLNKIDSNTDLKNSDKNSLGNQINDLVATHERVVRAIVAIDKRVPDVARGLDTISHSIDQNFRTMHEKLSDFASSSHAAESTARRLETLLSKVSAASFPENDNHIPNQGSLHGSMPPLTTMYGDEL